MKLTITTLTVDDDESISTTLHHDEADALASLRRNYEVGPEIDDVLEYLTSAQGLVIYVEEHTIEVEPIPADQEKQFQLTNPDGGVASIEQIAQAMEEASRADDGDMSCPVLDCSGKIEAAAPFWIGVTPEGMVHLDGIGWMESGKISCSHGGEGHVPEALYRSLEPTIAEYCANAETMLGAAQGEDDLRAGRKS